MREWPSHSLWTTPGSTYVSVSLPVCTETSTSCADVCLRNCSLVPACVFTLQKSMVVPSTPLHTTRVLTEDRAMWEDVKVRTAPALTLSGQTLTLQPGAMVYIIKCGEVPLLSTLKISWNNFPRMLLHWDHLRTHLLAFSVFKLVHSPRCGGVTVTSSGFTKILW